MEKELSSRGTVLHDLFSTDQAKLLQAFNRPLSGLSHQKYRLKLQEDIRGQMPCLFMEKIPHNYPVK
jgi:hypothetical protein